MTLAVQNSFVTFNGDGITTVFETDYPYYDRTTLAVTYGILGTETTLVLGVGFTADATGIPTGTVTLSAPIAVGQKVKISRILPLTQDYQPPGVGGLDATALMIAIDKVVMMVQQLNNGVISGSFVHGNLAGGLLHAVASGVAAGFMAAADYTALYAHIANVANPHATTAVQVAAAPDTHVGSINTVTGHPEATDTTRGFISAANNAKLNAIPVGVDPRNLMLFDDMLGPALDTSKWTRTTTGTAPTVSKLTDEWGVYREATGAAVGSMLLRSTTKISKPARSPEFETRVAVGALGAIFTLMNARWGFDVDPSTHASNYAFFHWDGTNLICRSRGAGAEQFTSLALADQAYHVYKVQVLSTSVRFYVDGALVATHNTQVPIAAAIFEHFYEMSVGTAITRSIDIDYTYTTATRAYT